MISDGKVLSLLLDSYVKPFAASAAVLPCCRAAVLPCCRAAVLPRCRAAALPRHMRLDIHHKCSYIKS